MSESKQDDPKARFKAALDRKNQKTRRIEASAESEGSRKLQESSGKTPKMFRRKSG